MEQKMASTSSDTWLVVAAVCLLIAVIGVAAIKRIFFPPPLDPVEMEFDLRATNLPKQMEESALELARTRQLANRRYTLRRLGAKKRTGIIFPIRFGSRRPPR